MIKRRVIVVTTTEEKTEELALFNSGDVMAVKEILDVECPMCPRCETTVFTRGVVKPDTSVDKTCDDCGRVTTKAAWLDSKPDDSVASPKNMRRQRNE